MTVSTKTSKITGALLLSAALFATPIHAHASYAGIGTGEKTVLGHSVQLVYVNLNDSNIEVQAVPAGGKVGTTESLSQIAQENGALAAINGGFFNSYSDGQPLTILKSDGTFEHNGSFGAAFGINDQNQTFFERIDPTIVGGTNGSYDWPHSWYAWGINHYYSDPSAITILTPDVVKHTLSGGKTVVVSNGVVTQIVDGDANIPSDGYLIHFGASEVKSADTFHVGDTVQYKINYTDDQWDQVSNIMGGGPLLVQNGKVVVDPAAEKFTDPKQTSTTYRSIRTFIGVNADNRLVMGTVSDVTIYELADVVQALGLVNAVGMDSGASAGLYADGSYLTTPGRDLADAIIVKIRPQDNYDVYQGDQYLKSFSSQNTASAYAKSYANSMVKDKRTGSDVWDNYPSEVFQRNTYLNYFTSRLAAEQYAKKFDHSEVYDVTSKSNIWSNWPLTVILNNQEQSYDQPPVNVSGRVLVPMRGILEKLGFQVTWDASTNSVTATKGDQVIVLKIGSTTAQVNGQDETLDVASKVVNGRTMVPLRFVAESSGADVTWNGVMNSVYITTK